MSLFHINNTGQSSALLMAVVSVSTRKRASSFSLDVRFFISCSLFKSPLLMFQHPILRTPPLSYIKTCANQSWSFTWYRPTEIQSENYVTKIVMVDTKNNFKSVRLTRSRIDKMYDYIYMHITTKEDPTKDQSHRGRTFYI